MEEGRLTAWIRWDTRDPGIGLHRSVPAKLSKSQRRLLNGRQGGKPLRVFLGNGFTNSRMPLFPHMLLWICSLLLMMIALLATVANALTLIRYVAGRRRGSAVPLIGGIAGAGALWILPISGAAAWWWIPLIVDYGSLPLLVYHAISKFRG